MAGGTTGPGAARRLHELLLAGDLEVGRVVLVLEGKAHSGVQAVGASFVGPSWLLHRL